MCAAVVCRELGYYRGEATCCAPQSYGRYYQTFVMARVDCLGNESRLQDCNHSTSLSDITACDEFYASVVCYRSNDTGGTDRNT